MTSLNVIENKISDIQKYLKILEGYQWHSLKEIEADITLRGAIERYLYLAIQATIDLSEAVVAFQKFRKPTIYAENFTILNEEKVIDANLRNKMSKMVGFRNIITHDYASTNLNIVYETLQNSLEDINIFIKIIASKFLA